MTRTTDGAQVDAHGLVTPCSAVLSVVSNNASWQQAGARRGACRIDQAPLYTWDPAPNETCPTISRPMQNMCHSSQSVFKILSLTRDSISDDPSKLPDSGLCMRLDCVYPKSAVVCWVGRRMLAYSASNHLTPIYMVFLVVRKILIQEHPVEATT